MLLSFNSKPYLLNVINRNINDHFLKSNKKFPIPFHDFSLLQKPLVTKMPVLASSMFCKYAGFLYWIEFYLKERP